MEAFRAVSQAADHSQVDDAEPQYTEDATSATSYMDDSPGQSPGLSPEMSREAPGRAGSESERFHQPGAGRNRVSDSGTYGTWQSSPQKSSFSDTSDLNMAIDEHVRQSIADVEARLASMLQGVTDDLATDIGREQQHLMLMQDQMDKQGQIMLKELQDVNKKMEQEKTQRSFVQRSVRENRELLHSQIQKQANELEMLRAKLADLETPWLVRMVKGLYGAMWGCSTRTALAHVQQYQHSVQSAGEMRADGQRPLAEAQPIQS